MRSDCRTSEFPLAISPATAFTTSRISGVIVASTALRYEIGGEIADDGIVDNLGEDPAILISYAGRLDGAGHEPE
jgi:hypothetical protein